MSEKENLLKWFSEIKKEDENLVGKKARVIGEMYAQKFPMSPGFVLTSEVYDSFMESNGLRSVINLTLDDLNIGDKKALKEASEKIIQSIYDGEFSKEIKEKVIESYDLLDVDKETIKNASSGALNILQNSREPAFVALRTSLSDNASRSSEAKTDYFVNIKGHKNLMENIKKIYASFFKEEEIFHRLSNKIESSDFKVPVIVQKMINSDKSGIIYSHNQTQNASNIVVEGLWGLGIGRKIGVDSDRYVMNKENMEIVSQNIAKKESAVTRDSAGDNCTVKLTPERSAQQTITNHELKMLGQYALKLEEITKKPQMIDFSISNGEISILGSRDIEAPQKKAEVELDSDDIENKILKELEKEEYRPGSIKEKYDDMPRLNDAIFVEEQRDLDDESKIDLV